MRIKRVLQGTALTALAAAAWMGAGSADASAAVNPGTGVEFDGTSLKITAENDDLEIMTSVAKVSTKGVKISSWDVYEGNSAVVDLSKLNVTKDNYIAIKTDDAPAFLVKIAATTKKTKVTIDKEKATITKVDLSAGTADKVQVRTAVGSYGTAKAVGDWDLSNYQYQGASLYVRIPAAPTAPTIEEAKLDSAVKDDTTKYDVYDIGTLPGKEAKVNIAKQANGPSVPVDYVKGKVTIPNKTQYRVVVKGTALASSSSAVTTQKDPKNVSELLNGAKKAILEVRKAATTGKKCASKWTRVVIEAPKTFLEDSIAKEFNANAATDGAIAEVTTNGALKIKYATKTVKRVESKTGFEITNETKVAFQYYVGDNANTAVDKDIKTLKAEKGKATLKKEAAAGKKIWIRVAGEKKSARWAGEWTELGTLPTIS